MKLTKCLFVAVSLAVLQVNLDVIAQDTLPANWSAACRDACNSSSTPVVPPANLKILWEKPSAHDLDATTNPRVYSNSEMQQIVVSGSYIYEAWTGQLLANLPYAARYSAVTTDNGTDVLIISRLVSGSPGSIDEVWELCAYDISDLTNGQAPGALWSLRVDTDLGMVGIPEINAKDGTLYVHTSDGVGALKASNGNIQWKSYASEWPISGLIEYGPLAIASTIDNSVVEDRVFVTVSGVGMVALSGDGTGSVEIDWHQQFDAGSCQASVDELAGIAYVSASSPPRLLAFDTSTGQPAWNSAASLDFFLNTPPTLGWAQDALTSEIHPAVFCVTGGMDGNTGVYALNRWTGQQLWQSSLPIDAWKSAVYCGDQHDGKLYIQSNNDVTADPTNPNVGHTYVFDAFSGAELPSELMATDALGYADSPGPAIVDVVLPDGATHDAVMYVATQAGTVAAWSVLGQTPPPPIYHLEVEALSPQISTASSTDVVAKLRSNTGESLQGMTITFSDNASRNQGYLESTSAIVDANGDATVTYVSQSRTGTVTITATGPGSTSATCDIVISKDGDEPPPAATGSISGTVYTANGKPARKVSVELYVASDFPSNPPFKTATSNPKGSYSFGELPFGDYIVFAQADAEAGMTDPISITEANPAATADVQMQ